MLEGGQAWLCGPDFRVTGLVCSVELRCEAEGDGEGAQTIKRMGLKDPEKELEHSEPFALH